MAILPVIYRSPWGVLEDVLREQRLWLMSSLLRTHSLSVCIVERNGQDAVRSTNYIVIYG